ncbi:MAG TPA: FadR/GntR family transcriptional regulator [Stellaceae bacterium]
MPFQTISTQRLYQQAAQQIRELIARGEFRPGDRLPPERDLARKLGISRPTVREAMVALEIAGLIEIRTGAGIFVSAAAPLSGSAEVPAATAAAFDAGPSPLELLAARRMIEGEIAAEAARLATDQHFAAIGETIDEMKAELVRGGAAHEADRAFHRAIAAATGNSVLEPLVDGLFQQIFSPLFDTMSRHVGLPSNLRMTIADHSAILDALRQRDGAAARHAMHSHLRHVEEILMRVADLAAARPSDALLSPAHDKTDAAS